MSENIKIEMISAFAAGCMDAKNYLSFKEYIETGGELPAKRLSELQNIISILPLLESPETPSDALKQSVAKKLLSLNEELKDKIEAAKKPREKQSENKKAEEKSDIPEKMKTIPEKKAEKTATLIPEIKNASIPVIPEPALPSAEPSPFESAVDEESPIMQKIRHRREQIDKIENTGTAKNYSLLIFSGIALIIILMTAGIFILYTITDNRLNDISAALQEVTTEVRDNSSFRENYLSIVEFFNLSDITTFNLKSSAADKDYSAKFMLSKSSGKGLLHIYNLPSPGNDSEFQLWVKSGGQTFAILTFVPIPGKKFFEISELPVFDMNNNLETFITIEERGGASNPSGQLLLNN
ncbi:MAG: anti-sigma factor [Ignavibacteriales bacterium]|nr:anti-sigma factor [Ignavibacteriales bacterium]MCF8435733.1 anti-sigma factor [Ignavibacteriales bacterium]